MIHHLPLCITKNRSLFPRPASISEYFSQDDVDSYLDELNKADLSREKSKKQSRSTKLQIRAALKFYLCNCLELNVNLQLLQLKSN